ncbi:MAG: RNA polymerase sigma-70 factor [Proteiniphilum sp.]|jgi:RNA polymerase sigma-70 factor (ECF subfamily)|nr:RNA polymerase sigma-70 factor [Proteiniphilum sp.]
MKQKEQPPLPDTQAITRTQFEEIFCRLYPQIATYASVILDDRTAGEDIAQEVFAYLWEKRHTLQSGNSLHSYLFQSAYTRCIDSIKKNRRNEKYTRESLRQFTEEYHTYLENNCQPIRELLSKDFRESLDALLSRLPPARRQIFNLVYRDGLKAKDVAQQLQIPRRTVESHIYLTLKFLRTHLAPNDFFLLTLLFFAK